MAYPESFLTGLRRDILDKSEFDESPIYGAGLEAFKIIFSGKPIAELALELLKSGSFDNFKLGFDQVRDGLEKIVLRAAFCKQTYPDFLTLAYKHKLSFERHDKNIVPGVPRNTSFEFQRFSPVRCTEGGFVDIDSLNFQLRSKIVIDAFAARILMQDDPEGLIWFLALPLVQKRILGLDRREWLISVNKRNVDSRLPVSMVEAVAAWIQDAPFSYARYFREMLGSLDSKDDIQTLSVIYSPEHTSKVGTEMLVELLDSKRQHDRYYPLIESLVRDGADWYQSFIIAAYGRGAIHDIDPRTPASDRFAEVMGMKGFAPGKLGAMIRGLDEHLVIEYASTHQKASELYKLSGRRCLLPFVGGRLRDSIFSGDMGL